MRFRVSCVVGALMLLAATFVLADVPTKGIVTGVVVGPDGAPLPGATVQLQGGRGTQTAVSDAKGAFRFVDLIPGSYTVRAELSGFQTTEGAIAVAAGVRADVELKMSQAISEQIAVTGEVPLISKYEAAAGTTLPANVTAMLVFEDRGLGSVVTMMPGVVHTAESQNLGNFAPLVNGGEPQENGTFLDGLDTSSPATGGLSAVSLPTTAMAEVRQDGAGYTSEYGRTVSGVASAITKSGTNDFHGNFLYIAQNQAWRAQSEHVPVDRPDEIKSSYELSLGGPIVRDKAWFFAGASTYNTNLLTSLESGELIDTSAYSESQMLKLTVDPSSAHRLSLSAVNNPVHLDLTYGFLYDLPTVTRNTNKARLYAADWTWVVSDRLSLELRAAHTDYEETVKQTVFPEVVPGANPDGPAGNQSWYYDLATGFIHHSIWYGPNDTKWPRDQANLSFNWFAGSHQLNFGLDYQHVDYKRLNGPTADHYLGLYYNDALPLGFVVPVLKWVYVPATEWVTTTTTAQALFVQDRFDVGRRWTFSVGLRYDDQKHTEAGGQTLTSSSNVAPRLAAIWDTKGNGTLLVKATANRYYTLINQNTLVAAVSANDGSNVYDQYIWLADYGIYYPIGRQDATSARISNVHPYHKDEFTLGVDWQVHPKWVFGAHAIYWQIKDITSVQSQFDETGSVYKLIYDIPGSKREYKGLQLELNRSFADGWMLRTNYTLSRTEGNCFLIGGATTCAYKEASAILDPATGQPVTTVNSWGRAPYDATHIVNIAGAKAWQLGRRHTMTLGGFLLYRSGLRWAPINNVVLTDPVSGQAITTSYYAEPRGSRSLPGYYTLNMNLEWAFPLAGQLAGSLRVEATNLTNQQTQININEATSQPYNIGSSYLKPREFRLVAGFSF